MAVSFFSVFHALRRHGPSLSLDSLGDYASSMQRYDFIIYTAYSQVELTDSDQVPEESWGASCAITDEDLQRQIKVVPGVIRCFTGRDGQSPFSVELLETEPEADFSAWDHVVEASWEMRSETLTVGGLYDTTEVRLIPVLPGSYRVRLQSAKLDSIRDPVLDGGEDHYLVRLWPALAGPLIVLKQYTHP